jgi:hypothetical protein
VCLLRAQEFAKIQAHLPQRTVQEVVALYYAIQHTDEFAHTRRKYLLRKRREQVCAFLQWDARWALPCSLGPAGSEPL